MDSGAISRVGKLVEIMSWLLLKSSYGMHVTLAYQKC